MRTHHLPKLPESHEFREAVRIARQYARTGIYERIIDPPHDPDPPAGSLRPVESGTTEPEPETLPTITDQVRLPVPDAVEGDRLELERYFTSATIPSEPFRINTWTTVQNPIKTIHYHLTGLKAAPAGSLVAKADMANLREIKAALEAGKQVLNYAIHT